jgi:hypothetical protein
MLTLCAFPTSHNRRHSASLVPDPQVEFPFPTSIQMKDSLMQASHCPEIDTRWPYEYGILNFTRRWTRTWSTANQQPKQVRCLQKVTRWHPKHTRRQHEDVNSLYPQDTRRPHEGHTMATQRRIESPSKTPEQSPEGSRSPQRSERSHRLSERSPQQFRRSPEDALRLAFYMFTLP